MRAFAIGCWAGLVACTSPDPDKSVDTAALADTGSLDVRSPDADIAASRLDLGDEVVCDNPDARGDAAFDVVGPDGDWGTQPYDPASQSLFVGGGLAIADFDRDGHLDLFSTAFDDRVALYLGAADGTWTAAFDRVPALPERTVAATPVDIDADGDLDLYVTVFRGSDVLLRNDGTGHFVDDTLVVGLGGGAETRSMSASFGDLDGDGDLDAFVAGYGALQAESGRGLGDPDPSHLYRQEDSGSFTDLVAQWPSDHLLNQGHAFTGAWTDADGDGWQDLYVVHDFGWKASNRLLHNGDGTLTPRDDLGLEFVAESMGLGIGDVNQDEVPDFLVPAWDTVALLVSEGSRWFDRASSLGLEPDSGVGQHTGWGGVLADIDNDGDLDATVVFGHLAVSSSHDNPLAQSDGVWLQQDDGQFVDEAAALGLDQTFRARGVLLVDLDRNGWLDVIRRDLQGPTRIDMQRCGTAAWLRLDARQPGHDNPFAVGTTFRVIDGERVWRRTIHAGGRSYASSGPPEVHLGLGDRDTVDRIEVYWPDGTISTAEDVPTRRHARFTRTAP